MPLPFDIFQILVFTLIVFVLVDEQAGAVLDQAQLKLGFDYTPNNLHLTRPKVSFYSLSRKLSLLHHFSPTLKY